MKKALFISIVTLMVGGQALAHGHGPRGGGRAAHFETMDADGDGRITKNEWSAHANQRFSELDANNDKKVTRAEMEAHRASKQADRFASLDANGDGKLSREELSRLPDRWFERLDENRDGFVTKAEFERPGPRGGHHFGERLFERMDANGDGVVTVAEARTVSLSMFDKLDKNGDGVLTREELSRRGHGKGKKGGERGARAPRGAR